MNFQNGSDLFFRMGQLSLGLFLMLDSALSSDTHASVPKWAFATLMVIGGLHAFLRYPPPPPPVQNINGLQPVGIPRDGENDDMEGNMLEPLVQINLNALAMFEGALVIDGPSLEGFSFAPDRVETFQNFRDVSNDRFDPEAFTDINALCLALDKAAGEKVINQAYESNTEACVESHVLSQVGFDSKCKVGTVKTTENINQDEVEAGSIEALKQAKVKSDNKKEFWGQLENKRDNESLCQATIYDEKDSLVQAENKDHEKQSSGQSNNKDQEKESSRQATNTDQEKESSGQAKVKDHEKEFSGPSEIKVDENESLSLIETNVAESESLSLIRTNYAESESLSLIGTNYAESESLSLIGTNYAESESLSLIGTNYAESESLSLIGTNVAENESLSLIETKVDESESLAMAETKVDENESLAMTETKVDESESFTVAKIQDESKSLALVETKDE